MKIAFLSELPHAGKFPRTSTNVRTDLAWSIALGAYHYPLPEYRMVKGYDFVFIIWPKAALTLDQEGSQIASNRAKLFNSLVKSGEVSRIIPTLKQNNGKILFIQEGPSDFWEDYSLSEQEAYLRILSTSDGIFCHNKSDIGTYSIWGKPVHVIAPLLLEDTVKDIVPQKNTSKIIIGGNFCKWYGGLRSYIAALPLTPQGYSIVVPSMHNHRGEEKRYPHLSALPYLQWTDWMKELSTFTLGIHLMPTVAAGTFALNCAYFGIPVVGNSLVDTQVHCFPNTSLENVHDIEQARDLLSYLHTDSEHYSKVSQFARGAWEILYSERSWLNKMNIILQNWK
jgi:hypothetical protein